MKTIRNLLVYFRSLLFLGLILTCGCNNDDPDPDPNPEPVDIPVKFVVVDTDELKHYDDEGNEISAPGIGEDFYGQDAAYSGVMASYQDNNNGTVTDLNTGLMWEKGQAFTQSDLEPDRYTWEEANEYCEKLTTGGYTDWRMPTLKELMSIVMWDGLLNTRSEASSKPFLDPDYFDYAYSLSDGNISALGQSWASTQYTGKSGPREVEDAYFMYNFADGHIKVTAGPNIVRAVRGTEGVFENIFVDNGDETITDQATGLMWQKGYGEDLNWKEALAYAENLELAGYSDWRLPNAKELQSIVDYKNYDWDSNTAAIDLTYFDGPTANYDSLETLYFWSSTSPASNPWTALYVSFGRALGLMEDGGAIDTHGAGALRSDPKTGDPDDWASGLGPDFPDVVSIYNYVRAVRDVD